MVAAPASEASTPSASRSGGTTSGLHVIATPLGNAADLSPRAREVLARLDCLYCEDTRTTGRLLAYLGIPAPPMRSLHARNERQRIEEVLRRLDAGEAVGLAADAGTPGISDPGGEVVAAAHERGHRVRPVAGPCAVTALLSVAGFPSGGYTFLGFLPKSPGPMRRALGAALRPGTVAVAYVPMRDMPRTAAAIADLQPLALCTLGRELTKIHEEVLRLPAAALLADLEGRPRLLGEASLAIWTPPEAPEAEPDGRERAVEAAVEALRSGGMSRRDMARLLADLSGLPRRRITEIIHARERRRQEPGAPDEPA